MFRTLYPCHHYFSSPPPIGDGKSDVSPRGDGAGFVKVYDTYRLVYPEAQAIGG